MQYEISLKPLPFEVRPVLVEMTWRDWGDPIKRALYAPNFERLAAMDVQQRFWAKVSCDDDGCWRFHPVSGVTQWYGRFSSRQPWTNGEKYAHRIIWRAWNNNAEIPKGHEIHHTCGTRNCVNPWHLRLVTHAENMREQHGTSKRSARARFTEADLAEIRRLREAGLSYDSIGARYGVSHTAIRHIFIGKTYRPLAPTPAERARSGAPAKSHWLDEDPDAEAAAYYDDPAHRVITDEQYAKRRIVRHWLDEEFV